MPLVRWLIPLMLPACSGSDPGGKVDDTGTVDGPPDINISTLDITFERIAVGETAVDNFIIQNWGKSDLDITGVSVPEPFSTGFTGLITLQAGGATTIQVFYAPVNIGTYEEVITVNSTDPDLPIVTIPISGDTIRDADGDGFDVGTGAGSDCDDTNPDVNPAAEEVYYNGIDDNCACENARCSDYDQDGDGYDASAFNPNPDANGGDCVDSNPKINPGMKDVWYDGEDSDCDGWNDYDQDGDGYSSTEHRSGGLDCDDDDVSINPEADESFNGVDDDCDGDVDRWVDGSSVDWLFSGIAEDHFGEGLTMGDVDNDGRTNLVVGAPWGGTSFTGYIAIYEAGFLPTSGTDAKSADDLIYGDTTSDQLGHEVAWLPEWGTGGDHLVVGAPGWSGNTGYASVLDGSLLSGATSLSDAEVLRIEGVSSRYLGEGLSPEMDLDADGVSDLVGSYRGTSSSYGAAFILYGDSGLTGTHGVADVDARLTISDTDATYARQAWPAGAVDFDDDGYEDLLLCAEGYGNYIVYGGNSSSRVETGSEQTLSSQGDLVGSGAGYMCAGVEDWDGDGKDDIFTWDEGDQVLYGVLGGDYRGSSVSIGSDYYVKIQFDSLSAPPEAMYGIGDWNGDGGHELAVSLGSTSVVLPGSVYVFDSSMAAGDYKRPDDEAALGTLRGEESVNELYGSRISNRRGDMTYDGRYEEELVLADHMKDGGTGGVYIYKSFAE